jgi:hypothetical protein
MVMRLLVVVFVTRLEGERIDDFDVAIERVVDELRHALGVDLEPIAHRIVFVALSVALRVDLFAQWLFRS